jgi:predicted unusual protein kinase regulating ubiquinone biosynthesis (AarF/ABC1/UbiB family)
MTKKNASKLKLIKIIIKLLPIIVNFKRDRKEWVKREGKNVDENKYRKHAQQALKIFIQLGPSYIKLGQWLSSRSDILPQPYLEVFATLQDDVPVESFEKVKKIIEEELGNLEEKFEYFNKEAFSGASLGQVYHARYNGKEVVVKISRPGIERIVEEDISIIKKLIPLSTRFIDPNLRFSVEGMFSQFTETIYEEMDYIKEAENLLAIKKNLAKEKKIIIPNVILDRTSKHIITMEYEPGIKITDVETLDKKGIDRQKLVILIHHIFFKMLLRNNIFHSDPHPGNIAVKDDGSIILYDFGMVGRLDNETRLLLIRLYLGLIDKDPVRTVDVLYQLGTLDYTTNRNIVEKAIELSIRSMHGKHVDKMEVKSLMDLSNKTLSKFPFRLPKNLALYMRMTSIVEGIYHQHKIKFQFVKVLSNLFEQEGLINDAYIEEIKYSFQKFIKNIETSVNLSQNIKTYLDNQETNIKKTDKLYTFLGKSIFASALFVGSAFLFSYNPIISSIGFICSIILFVFSIIKK